MSTEMSQGTDAGMLGVNFLDASHDEIQASFL